MAALTGPRNTPAMGGEGSIKATLQVKAATKIYQGALVMTDNTGYALPAATNATAVAWGVAISTVDNTGGSSGALSVDTSLEQMFLFNASGLTQAAVGAYAYMSDDNTISLTSASNSKVGTIAIVVSATQCWVYVGIQR